MKKLLLSLCVALLASLAVVPTGIALAAEITFVSVVGSWRDPTDSQPGSQPGDPAITNGDPISSISWGTTSGPQSGYDFIATLPPPFELPGDIPFFSLGTFQHRNFVVDEPWLTSVQLDVELVLAVDGVPTGPLTFTFTLNHDETRNDLDPCPYPTPPGEGCTDRVTIVASAEPTTFNVDGVDYTLEMSFLDNGSAVDEFITREGDTVNSSGLVGEFTLPPGLTVTKTGPATMRLAEYGNFVIGIQNESEADAYNMTLVDVLPDGPTGGMCDMMPEILSAQVFEADGVTPVAGKGPLAEGSDYTLAWDPATCQLTFGTLSAASVIGVTERLIIGYRTQLDADSQDGEILTNVAGAIEWFNADASTTYLRVLTDGTVGVGDHEDAHSVTVDLPELRFEKTVINVTTGEDPGTVATPGDTLRYQLYVENLSDVPIDDFEIVDELDRLNADPMFQAGTLNVISIPAGADAANSDPNGGAAGTGLLDVRNLSIGGLGETILVEFEVQLAPVIPNDTFVYNQSELTFDGLLGALSDDPNVNGQADPTIPDDDDPTQILIQSAPAFDVDKISSYIDGQPTVLLAGETLRYTITVRNIGTDHATNVDIVDQVPANTTYVAGSTTLNGEPVADADGGASPLIDGILINSADNTTPGLMNAGVAGNTATIVFDVVVYPDVPDGTLISNQAFVGAEDYGIADVPSDDPRTEVPDDPTVDVVGNFPLIFAPKSAELVNDLSSPGIVDPGDTLRYTITIYNNGTVPATAADLTDIVPANTTYVEDTVTLNGQPVGQPDAGVFPLIDGIDVSSADLTPPVPGEGEGIINPGEAAVVRFDVIVNADAIPGTLITNQATVYSMESGDVLTDGDGNPATGPEPTVVVVGDVQQLSIIKEVSVVDGGPALPGATLEYAVTVTNIGALPALYVQIQDDLSVPNPGYLTYVDDSARMNGLADGITVNDTLITADYFTEYGALEPDQTVVLRFRAIINPDLAVGTTVTNTALVYWDDPLRQLEASVSIDVGARPNAGMLSGEVWHDADHDNTPDGAERLLQGWLVELVQGGQTVSSAFTDADGAYMFMNVRPNYPAGEPYSLRFSAPGAGPLTAVMGQTDSDFTDGQQLISDIEVTAGSNLLALNMPVDPNGVVYDSIARSPIAGATVTLRDARSGTALPPACFDDPNQQGQTTVPNGYYKFDINFSDPACPSGLGYVIDVTVPDATYLSGVSELIPPASTVETLPFDVPACPGSAADAVAATSQYCEAQPSEFQPAAFVEARSAGTTYHLFLTLDSSQVPNSSQLFNNHIPLDPRLDGAVAVTKTTPMVNVTRGQVVPYVITVTSSFGFDLNDVTVIDSFPAGFKYVEGSARIGDVPTEPEVVDRQLIWDNLFLPVDGTQEIRLLLTVGAGVREGEFVNRAQAVNSLTGGVLSEEATATVRLVPDPTFDCTDVSGKVYDDLNLNGLQDPGEAGIPGVRVVTMRGLAATTDTHGRYHITCAATPNEARGSNFALKLDDRSLPSGFRTSTRPVQIQRATRGKALRVNFGASIHRVVGLDIADAVFVPGEVVMRDIWRPRIQLLLTELKKAPSVLRLSYVADTEDERLVDKRLELLKEEIIDAWLALDPGYELAVEPEVYWRLGGPPDRRNTEGR
ncbi:MAG: SdrD B-like domain-containing protein [Woeseiaceae bacterium]|nr:SdrD B-like domain-containing protein [Woeseiaceae bacterium]